MEYIKIVSKKRADYIPEDGILCSRCKYYETCPVDYICDTLDRQLENEFSEDCEA